MAKDDRRNLGGSRMEGAEPEERMEDWFKEGSTTSEFEEGEVVRGRVVHVGTSEVLVDVGYKSEGAIPIEEFHRHGALPKVGEEIEVYLEAKEDSEGLIVLSKDKADKIKVWDAITQAYEKAQPVEGRVVEVVKGGLAAVDGEAALDDLHHAALDRLGLLIRLGDRVPDLDLVRFVLGQDDQAFGVLLGLEVDLDLLADLRQRAVAVELLDRDRALALVADVDEHFAAADVDHAAPDDLAFLELARRRAFLEPVLHAFLRFCALHARTAEVPPIILGHAARSSPQ